MRLSHFCYFAWFGLSTVIFRRKKPILATIILTDRCNLRCKHCAVSNISATMPPYRQIRDEMLQLYRSGIRVLLLYGGEPFLWRDGDMTLRDLVIEAKRMGFPIVNVVTNGTFALELPEADLIMVSIDGDRDRHNDIRGDTYDTIIKNIDEAESNNICLYMAINRINQDSIRSVCELARQKPNVRAVSFNFHTPYPGTEDLALSTEEKRSCCNLIADLIDQNYPIFNLKSAFSYIVDSNFPTPCRQCVIMENGKLSVCGRCVDVPGLCENCGYFFAAEYALVFSGNIKTIVDMVRTYTKYIRG